MHMDVIGSQLLLRDGRSAAPRMQCSKDLEMWVRGRRLAVGQREPDMPVCSLWAAEQLLAVQLQEGRDHLGLVGLHSVHQQAPQNGHLQPLINKLTHGSCHVAHTAAPRAGRGLTMRRDTWSCAAEEAGTGHTR